MSQKNTNFINITSIGEKKDLLGEMASSYDPEDCYLCDTCAIKHKYRCKFCQLHTEKKVSCSLCPNSGCEKCFIYCEKCKGSFCELCKDNHEKMHEGFFDYKHCRTCDQTLDYYYVQIECPGCETHGCGNCIVVCSRCMCDLCYGCHVRCVVCFSEGCVVCKRDIINCDKCGQKICITCEEKHKCPF